MKSARVHTRGFTLIASLLLLLLLSAMSVGLLMMVNTEGKVGGADVQNDFAYHSAEGGIEKMASDLAATFQNSQSPTTGQICNVGNTPPVMTGVTWMTYSVAPGSGCSGDQNAKPPAVWGQISAGPSQGLWAQIIPVSMEASASVFGGQEVDMMRSAQVALIPVFQFGVFSENDLAFFSNPTIDFNGRIHTNGDLYVGVAGGNTITFHDRLEAYGNIVTNNIPNTLTIGNANDNGTVYVPIADGDCPMPPNPPVASSTCKIMSPSKGSVTGMGGNPPASAYNGTGGWYTFSKTTVNYEVINGNYGNTAVNQTGTGAKKLSMPFVGGNALPYEIIRRPPVGEDTTSALATSREYNMAQIRVLLSDDPQDFVGTTTSTNPGNADANNVRLANVAQTSTTVTQYGVQLAAGNYTPTLPAPVPNTSNYNLYFATASNAISTPNCSTSANCNLATGVGDWPIAPWPWTAVMQGTEAPASTWPLLYSNTVLTGVTVWAPWQSPNTNNLNIFGVSGNGTAQISLCPPASPPANAVPAGCPASGTAPPYPYYAANSSALYNTVGANVLANIQANPTWNLIDGWLRVEYKDANGNWNPVTNEWLALGFARDTTPPTANGAGTPAGGIKNPINPNAILLLQQPADRGTASPGAYTTAGNLSAGPAGTSGTPTAGIAPTCTQDNGLSGASKRCIKWSGTPPQVLVDTPPSTLWQFGLTPAPATTQSITQFNWYPINFYDAREGEARDVTTNQGNDSCTTNGVMNAVEIDVGNLKRWLLGQIGKNLATGLSSGPSVDYLAQNGYVLYFSDRRGMLYSKNVVGPHPAVTKSGDSGLEDVVNAASQAGTPDGVLEPPPAGGPKSPAGIALSPEDDNENGALDNWGTSNLGLGQYNITVSGANQITASTNLNARTGAAFNPYNTRINSCSTTGRKNWVSGARHVLKLVDGSLGNVPLRTDAGATPTSPGGFTVASENPVYIQDDYNSNAADNFWPIGVQAGVNDKTGHSAAAVIADAVTFLSNNWDDRNSMVLPPTQPQGNRPATTTYYRLAIAGGKNMSFPFPGWETGTDYPFGTDGGVGNFLRFLEDWQTTNATLNYGGSLVSLYFSTYNTGLFKCCSYSVYQPPDRGYVFDTDFTKPEGLPPGTPMFRDVESLGYRQLFTARTASN